MPGLCIEENTMAELTFRFAKRGDVPLIFGFINDKSFLFSFATSIPPYDYSYVFLVKLVYVLFVKLFLIIYYKYDINLMYLFKGGVSICLLILASISSVSV